MRLKIKNQRRKLFRKVYQLKVRLQMNGCASRALLASYYFDPMREKILADKNTVFYQKPKNITLGKLKSKKRGLFMTKCWNPRNTAPCSPTLVWKE